VLTTSAGPLSCTLAVVYTSIGFDVVDDEIGRPRVIALIVEPTRLLNANPFQSPAQRSSGDDLLNGKESAKNACRSPGGVPPSCRVVGPAAGEADCQSAKDLAVVK